MVVGALQVKLSIPMARSLKAKRSVVRRACDRVRNKFKVSVAEVADNDVHNRAVIGVAAVANDASFVNSILDKVVDQIERDTVGEAEIVDTTFELLNV